MAWWDDLFGLTPNAVSAATTANEPIVGKYRSADGRLDPNAIAGLGPAELADETRMRVQYANAARDMLPAEEPLTWNRAIGNALSAISVPVAYAQGNTQYGGAMTGRTLQDQWNASRDKGREARRNAESDLGVGVLSNSADAASTYYESKRKRRTEAVDTVAKMLAMAQDDPEAYKEGAAYLRGLGLTEDAAYIESRAPKAPATTPAATPLPGAVAKSDIPAVGSAEATGDTLPNYAGGLAQALPATPGAGQLASSSGDDIYQMPASIKTMYDRATRVSILDPKRGEALMKQAEAAANIWEKKQAAQFSSRDGAYSVQPTILQRDGKLILGQLSPKGEVVETKLPDGTEYYDPVALAGAKEFGKRSGAEQGEAQGKAQSSLPGLQYEADYITGTIDKLIAHPGRKNLTGKSLGGTVWSDTLPDFYEETGDARVLHDQIKSNAFLMAFEKLKGAGAITEQEGKAATQALTRLASLQQSDDGYLDALNDFRTRVSKFIDVARTRATARISTPGVTQPNQSPADLSDDEIVQRLSTGGR